MTTIHTITTMHMENQQQLHTRQSMAVNLTRQKNLNTTKTSLNTTRRIWIPRDGFEYHEKDLNTTRRIWIPRDGFEYHETGLNTTRRIWIPRDGFEYHETDLNTTRRVWITRDGFEYHETDLNTTRRIWIPRDGIEYHETNLSTNVETQRNSKKSQPIIYVTKVFRYKQSAVVTTVWTTTSLSANAFFWR